MSAVNAGIVDLGDHTIIFDTMTTIGAARELRAAAEALTGRAPAYVINSHAHADHFNGNVVFADAILVASQTTHRVLSTQGVALMERLRANMTAEFEAVRRRAGEAADEAERSRLQGLVGEYEEFFADYPLPDDFRLPTLTYERSVTLHGSLRSAQLVTFGGAHSPCDAVLWLPEEKVLFSADLVIPGDNQVMTLGEPANWLPILDELERFGAKWLVPGHRKVVPASDGLGWSRRYLTDILRVAEELAAAGGGPDAANSTPVPAGCSAGGYRANLRFLLGRHK